jgi:uncharacterized protein (DUF169 family)
MSQSKIASKFMSDLTKALKAEVSGDKTPPGIHPSYKARKLQVNAAFRALRKAGYLAEQNYWCCSTCAYAGGEKEAKEAGKKGFVFYNAQDFEFFKETGEVCIQFAHLDEDIDAQWKMGQEVAEALEAAGLNVKWDGDPATALLVV